MELDFSKSAPKPDTLEECHQLIDVLWQALRVLTQKFSVLEGRRIQTPSATRDIRQAAK